MTSPARGRSDADSRSSPLSERAVALDALYQRDCAQLDRDTPWLATFDLQLADRLVTYRISTKRVPDVRERDASIIGFAHPLAAAYYESPPGDAFELDHPRFAALHGTVVERTTATAISTATRRLAAVEIARATESGRCVRDGDAFRLEAAPPIATRSVTRLPDLRALLTPSSTTDGAPVDRQRVLIVMFNRALQRFVERSLADVELGAATIDIFHGWALGRINRAYTPAVSASACFARPGVATRCARTSRPPSSRARPRSGEPGP